MPIALLAALARRARRAAEAGRAAARRRAAASRSSCSSSASTASARRRRSASSRAATRTKAARCCSRPATRFAPRRSSSSKTWGERNGVPVIAQGSGADSASVIFDALQTARSRGTDVLIADTAGRLHTQSGLMDELSKIRRVLEQARHRSAARSAARHRRHDRPERDQPDAPVPRGDRRQRARRDQARRHRERRHRVCARARVRLADPLRRARRKRRGSARIRCAGVRRWAAAAGARRPMPETRIADAARASHRSEVDASMRGGDDSRTRFWPGSISTAARTCRGSIRARRIASGSAKSCCSRRRCAR